MTILTLKSNDSFTETELLELELRCIDIDSLQILGRGRNRKAYSAYKEVTSPGFSKPLKIPVTITLPMVEGLSESPNAVRNRNQDRDLNEVEILQRLGREGIETFESDVRRINIIPYPSKTDLEKLVQKRGPLKTRAEVQHIIGGILDHLDRAASKGVLHRDLKPDNIFLDLEARDYVGKPGDYQLAGIVDNITDSPLPTRGTGSYAHRSLLNSWATGKHSRASERTEVYSFGGILYYLFTGKSPSPYRIVDSDDGREVQIDERKFRLNLVGQDGEKLEHIDDREEELRINEMVKEVPSWARKFVYKCLTDTRGSFKTFGEANRYYRKMTEKIYDRENGRSMIPILKFGGIAIGLLIALGSFFGPSKEAAEACKKGPAEIRKLFYPNNNYGKAANQRLYEMGGHYYHGDFDSSNISNPINGEVAE